VLRINLACYYIAALCLYLPSKYITVLCISVAHEYIAVLMHPIKVVYNTGVSSWCNDSVYLNLQTASQACGIMYASISLCINLAGGYIAGYEPSMRVYRSV